MRTASVLAAILLATAIRPHEARAARVDVPPEITRRYRVEFDATTGYVVGLDDAESAARWRSCHGEGPADPASIDAALEFMWSRKDLFGLRAGVDSLVYQTSYSCEGSSWVTFEQWCRGVRVPGASVLVRLETGHGVVFVGGMFMPGLDIDLVPSLSFDELRALAARAVGRSDRDGPRDGELGIRRRPQSGAGLHWPDPKGGGFEDSRTGDYLVWATTLHSSDGTPWGVVLDAHTGRVLAKHVVIEGDIR